MTSINRPKPKRLVPSMGSVAVLIAALISVSAVGASATPPIATVGKANSAGPLQLSQAVRPVAGPYRSAAGKEVKYYVVQPSYNGEPEFLFEIAKRFLGNGDRWQEIFTLNVGRLQQNGGRLARADTITPGWVLILPADAAGDEVKTGVLQSPKDTSGADTADTKKSSGQPLLWIGGGIALLLGLLLLGYGLMVSRRGQAPAPPRPTSGRTPPTPVKPEKKATAARLWQGRGRAAGEPMPRPVDAAAAWTVDRALRSLAGLALAAHRQLPSFYAVSLDADVLRLRLAVPDHEPPAPWNGDEEGLSWEAPLRALQAVPLDEQVAAPSPRLVTLGMDGGTRVLLDLGEATGVIAVEGPAAGVRALLRGWINELAVCPWADEVQVVVAGLELPENLGEAGQRNRVQSVSAVRDALAAVNPVAADGAAAGWAGGGSVASVLRSGASSSGAPGVLILGNGVRGPEMEQIQALAGRPDAGWAVVLAGPVPAARWRFTLGSDGRLDTGVLGITVRATDSNAATLLSGRSLLNGR
jgi:LysM repeat protein